MVTVCHASRSPARLAFFRVIFYLRRRRQSADDAKRKWEGGREGAAANRRVSGPGSRKTEPHRWAVSSSRICFHVDIAIPPESLRPTDGVWTPCDSRGMLFGIRPRRRCAEMSRARAGGRANGANLSSLCLMHAESKEGIGKKKRIHFRTNYTNKRNIAVVARQSDCTVYRLPTMSPPLPTRRERNRWRGGNLSSPYHHPHPPHSRYVRRSMIMIPTSFL